MFESPGRLALGLLTGIIFGFVLQKGRVTKYEVIVGQFLLKDWTMVKIMATAVLVGSVGVYALVQLGLASLHIKSLLFGGVLAGGLCFGVGMAIFGYCPGTGLAACSEGRPDAMVGVLGMLFGAGLFVALEPALQPLVKSLGNAGKITLPQALGVSPWVVLSGLFLAAGAALVLLRRADRWNRRSISAGIGARWPSPSGT